MRNQLPFILLLLVVLSGCRSDEEENDDGPPPMQASATSWPDPVQGSHFAEWLYASGGTGVDYRWKIVSGSLPAGVVLPSRGTPRNQLCGTPAAAGYYSFTLEVRDNGGNAVYMPMSLTVQAAGTLREDTTEIAPATVGRSYISPLAASGGTGTGYYWTVATGSLPPGMYLDSTGTPPPAIKGTPTAAGDYSFTLQVTDSGTGAATRDFRMFVEAAGAPLRMLTTSFPGGVAGVPYAAQVHAVGGTGTLVFDLSSGSPGNNFTYANLGSYGDWTGTPAGPYIRSIGLRVRDGSGTTLNAAAPIFVDGPLNITTSQLQSAVLGSLYSRQVNGEGGSAEGYNWQVVTGSLPPGLALQSASATPSALITGTPSSLGNYPFTLQLQDSLGATATRALVILVALVPNPLQITTTTLPDATDGVAYSANIQSINGTTTKIWQLAAGALPPGISMAATGHPATSLSGTCTVPGDYNFTVEVLSGTESAQADLSIKVRPVLAITTSTLPDASQGQAYSQVVTAAGGNGAGFTWQVTQGALPAGLNLAASGTPSTTLSGSPTATGTFNFTVTVTDSDQNTGFRALSLFVDASGVISTIAGTGNTQPTADGSPPLQTNLFEPTTTRLDPAGNVVVLERGNHRVRRINAATGLIETIAGNGSQGSSGDGAAATSASFNYPNDIVYDGAGNLYIADSGNRVIRRVDSGGTVTRFAGTGNYGYSGDFGPALNANIDSPFCLAIYGGSLYFCEGDGHLRAINLTTNIITTIAGGGSTLGDGGPASVCMLGSAFGLLFDAGGNIYIAASSQNRVRVIDAGTGNINTICGAGGSLGDGGPASAASLNYPMGLCFDGAGNLLISDSFNQRIRKITTATGIITTIAGTGVGAFSGDGGQATSAQIWIPRGIRVDASGAILFCDSSNNRVRRISP